MTGASAPFLTAEWRHLVMLNYEVDPAILIPYVPRGTELDTWHDRHYVSVVGFRFLRTRLRGIPIPFHRDFDEINLRFYVGRPAPEGWRRGVVFIREVVPRRAIAAIARLVYNENYVACPTTHAVRLPHAGASGSVDFTWRPRGLGAIRVAARIQGDPTVLTRGSEAEFIAEHYWGCAVQRDGTTLEYRVDHDPWRVWETSDVELVGPAGAFYGEAFAAALSRQPTSAFVATGSPVAVYRGRPLDADPLVAAT